MKLSTPSYAIPRYLHEIIQEEIRKHEVATKRKSLKVEDNLAAEMIPQLVAEEVRLLELEVKKSILAIIQANTTNKINDKCRF